MMEILLTCIMLFPDNPVIGSLRSTENGKAMSLLSEDNHHIFISGEGYV